MDLDRWAILAGQATAIAGGLALLVRYVVQPLTLALRTLRRNSERIEAGLPLLDEWLRRWPDLSGARSFFEVFAAIEDLAQQTDATFRAALDLKAGPVYLCAVNGECEFANRAICELWGISRESMLGRGWLAGIAPEDRSRVWSRWQESINSEIPYECSYMVRNARDGKRWSVTTVAVPIRNVDGALIGYYGVFKTLVQLQAVTLPTDQAIATIARTGDRLELRLGCGHEFACDDNPQSREWLKKNRRMNCPTCSEVFVPAE